MVELAKLRNQKPSTYQGGRGSQQVVGRCPVRLEGLGMEAQLLWERDARSACWPATSTAPSLSHPPRKSLVYGGGDTRHRRQRYKQSQTGPGKKSIPKSFLCTRYETSLCSLYRNIGMETGAASSKKVVGPRSALRVLVVQNTPIKCLGPHQPLYPEAHFWTITSHMCA